MADSPFSLRQRRALVIGGGSGIGRAIALGLADAGADVHVAGRRADKLEESCAAIRGRGVAATAFAAHDADSAALDALVARVEASVGVPDVLVNAQGVMTLGPAEAYDEADFDRIMGTNVKSVWFACTRFGKGMLARGSGAVINIASRLRSVRKKPGAMALTRTPRDAHSAASVSVSASTPCLLTQ